MFELPFENLGLPVRRRFLQEAGLGFGSMALASMMQDEAKAAPSPVDPLALKLPHFPAKVKSIIWLFMTGAPSQVDTWDYKPELQKRDGQALAGSDSKTGFFSTSGKCLKSPFAWKQHGQSGSWVPEIFPHLSQHVDKMCFLHSMYLKQNNHAPASIELMCGTNRPGLPSMGAWLNYGLGSMNQDLPSFVVLHDTRPRGDDQIWSAGFLPKSYQALALDARRKESIDNLFRDQKHTDAQQVAQLDLMRKLNQHHASSRPTQSDLSARINSYELAYRMQMAAPEALDINKETQTTQKLYGIDKPECATFARQCLVARRMVERGVRFVQVFPSAYGVWDSHQNLKTNHTRLCETIDLPIAGLIMDLKQRGLMDDVLVVFCTEFGRTPGLELRGGGKTGRDHHPNGFTIWMAGAGIKKGYVHGATDELGYHALGEGHYVTDLHATTLHLLGVDNKKLEIPGRKRLEIDQGKPIVEILS